MTTQHQAPEVTSEDKDMAADIAHALGISAEAFISGAADALVKHLALHRTRAIQPLSLRKAAADLVAKLDECDPHIARMCGFVADMLRVSYSGPQYGEELDALRAALGGSSLQKAQTSAGDIDRSGLAQEVEQAEMADLIDRVGVLAAMDKLDSAGEQSEFAAGYDAAVRACIEAVENAPAREGMAAAIRARS